MKFAGTDSNVFVQLTGCSGEESAFVRLDNTFRDDFERGSVDRFRIKLEDIGRPAILTISKKIKLCIEYCIKRQYIVSPFSEYWQPGTLLLLQEIFQGSSSAFKNVQAAEEFDLKTKILCCLY